MKNKKYFLQLLLFLAMLGFLGFLASSKVLAASCEAGETCTQMTWDASQSSWVDPPGKDCYWRNACPGNQACCKAEAAATSGSSGANAVKTGTNATPTGATGFTGNGTSFANPLTYTKVDDLLTTVMNAIQKVIVSLALLMIVIGAVVYTTSGGGKQMESAKAMITAACVGFAIAIAAPSFLKEIAGVIGWGGQTPNAPSLTQIVMNALNFLLGILGILALVMMIIGASMYLTSAGDQTRIDTGKKIFKSSLIGVIIAMASMVLLTQIAKFFVTTPSSTPAPVNVNPQVTAAQCQAQGNYVPSSDGLDCVPAN